MWSARAHPAGCATSAIPTAPIVELKIKMVVDRTRHDEEVNPILSQFSSQDEP
jgi:hypothetical protein